MLNVMVVIVGIERSHLPLLQDDTQQVGAFSGDGLEFLREVGGLEGFVKVGQTFLSVFFRGGGRQECLPHAFELGGDGFLKEQVALGHVVAEVALHDAGVDQDTII